MANEEVSLNYKEEVNLYYKNVTSDIIEEHGITPEDLEKLAEQSSKVILKLNREREAKNTPYRDLPHKTFIAQQVKEIVDELKVRCENLVVLGIGGSALGNIALQTALNPYMYNLDDKQRTGPRLFIFDNIDPSQFDSFLQWIDDKLEGTIFNVISKSGQAPETISQFMIIHQLLLDKLGSEACKKQIIITTDAHEGILREITDNVGYRNFDVPKDVGGRFSVLSAVGLFSAAMCGIKIGQLLEGAYDMDKRVRNPNFRQNPAAINAAINYHFYKKGNKISVMMPYSYHLKDLADWYRQLWAESLGKARDLDDKEVFIGPTPVKALGTTDQTSQVQLYLEGPNDKLFTFLQVNKFDEDKDPIIGPAPRCAPELDFLAGNKLSTLLNNEKKATEYALLESKRPCLTVIFPEVNAYTVGQFIYLYEVTTSIAGALHKINPYDQGSVDKVKEATFALMGKPGDEYREFSQEIRSKTEIDKNFLV